MPRNEPLDRRRRKRQETFDEIVMVGRQLLNDGADLSLSAVAAEMGLTAPGLYRYVDSAESLSALIAGGILEDVIRAMTRVRDSFPDDDPAAQLAAATGCFRAWALARRVEFQLVFASTAVLGQEGNARPLSVNGGQISTSSKLLSTFFGSIFANLCLQGLIKAPASADLSPEIFAVLEASSTDEQRAVMQMLGDRGPGTVWLLRLAWGRLYGVLAVEVFGQIDEPTIESGLLFGELMHETFISLGMTDDWDRLLTISREAGEQQRMAGTSL
jgi:AcrR family transcriptional regulator